MRVFIYLVGTRYYVVTTRLLSRANEIHFRGHELLSRFNELLGRGHEIIKLWPRDTISWQRVSKSLGQDNKVVHTR